MFSICICKTVALNYREIEMNPERVSNIKPLINEYKWNGINYPSKIDEKNPQSYLKITKKVDLLKFLSNIELLLWLSCSQIDLKVVISIKYDQNTIAWAKVMHLGHFVQNV